LIPIPKRAAALLALMASAATFALLDQAQAQAQTQTQTQSQTQAPSAPAMNHSVVVLDPAHGGPDAGAKLGDGPLEKDVTLALAARLRTVLSAAGFTVVSTRQADSLDLLTTDQRAETANRTRALACLVIHATGSGSGVHLYASTLAPKELPDAASDAAGENRPAFEPTPWDTAQAESVAQSLRLESDLDAALRTTGIPVVAGRAALRPLDNLMCPAVAVEVAPLSVVGGDATPVTDAGYQQRVADTLARALQAWRGHADASAPAGTTGAAASTAPGGTQ
jgi:N-acetylmuramoyl-L-alanine amidase